MQIEQVDGLHAQTRQRCYARLADVGGGIVDAARIAARLARQAALGGDQGLAAMAGQETAQQLLVVAEAVGVGRVEQGHARRQGRFQRGQRLRLVRGAIKFRHAHAAQAQCRAAQATMADASLLQLHIDLPHVKAASLRRAGWRGNVRFRDTFLV